MLMNVRFHVFSSLQVSKDAKSAGVPGDPQSLYGFFVERCKQNVHIVLCLSPLGESFRQRLRMFPSLVNCCTIDWYHRWPKEARQAVATSYLKPIDVPDEVKGKIVDVLYVSIGRNWLMLFVVPNLCVVF